VPPAKGKRGRGAAASKAVAEEVEEEEEKVETVETPGENDISSVDAHDDSQGKSAKKRPKREAAAVSPHGAEEATSSSSSSSSPLKKSAIKTPKILFTGVEINAVAKKYLTNIGAVTCDDMSKATHLIASHVDNKLGLKRSSKVMQAISLCLPILDLAWLIDSAKAGYPLDEAKYIIQDKTAEDRFVIYIVVYKRALLVCSTN
jgi:hypothetical protein